MPPEENARNFPFLVYDGDDPMAGLALRGLPDLREGMPAAVHLHRQGHRQESRITSARPQFQPKAFDIDISVCMSCQICVEVCPFEAIKMDTTFELSNTDRFDGLLLDKHAAGQAQRILSEDSSHRGRGGG